MGKTNLQECDGEIRREIKFRALNDELNCWMYWTLPTRESPQLDELAGSNDDPENEIRSVANTKAELIPYLNNSPYYKDLPANVLRAMPRSTTFHTFNFALSAYDYADERKIWTGFMPTKEEAMK